MGRRARWAVAPGDGFQAHRILGGNTIGCDNTVVAAGAGFADISCTP
jgi:hypothetical protein